MRCREFKLVAVTICGGCSAIYSVLQRVAVCNTATHSSLLHSFAGTVYGGRVCVCVCVCVLICVYLPGKSARRAPPNTFCSEILKNQLYSHFE